MTHAVRERIDHLLARIMVEPRESERQKRGHVDFTRSEKDPKTPLRRRPSSALLTGSRRDNG